MVYKIIKSLLLISILAGCSIKSDYVYKADKDKTLLLGKKENPVLIKFDTSKYEDQYFYKCVDDSYTILGNNQTYGDLFVEYIRLSMNCKWNGVPDGFLISNIRAKLKLDNLEIVENYEINGYSFNTIKTDNNEYFSLIYDYNASRDIFIIDYKGLLYDKLLKSFKSDYKSKYLNEKRLTKRYEDSLVRKNLLENYFEEEMQSFE